MKEVEELRFSSCAALLYCTTLLYCSVREFACLLPFNNFQKQMMPRLSQLSTLRYIYYHVYLL